MAILSLRVKFLSATRYLVGIDEVRLEFDHSPTFSEVLEKIYEKVPRLKEVEEELKKRGASIVYVIDGRTPRRRWPTATMWTTTAA